MIKKVAIIGVGAIGSYFVWGLENKCTIITDGARKERLQKEGIFINDEHYNLCVKDYEKAGKFDLVLICTKYDGLVSVCQKVSSLLHDDTIVLSLLNGVDSEEILSQYIDSKHIIHSLMRIASKRENNHIYFDPSVTLGVFFGSVCNDEEKIDTLVKFFDTTSIRYHVMDDILQDMWIKYASNIANNLPQAITQIPSVAIDSEHGSYISKRLWDEVYTIAKAKGISIPEQKISFGSIVPKSSKFSTLQDIEAKRHTEIDMFLGVLIRYGKELHIDLPFSEYTYHLIKILEENNDGLFEKMA